MSEPFVRLQAIGNGFNVLPIGGNHLIQLLRFDSGPIATVDGFVSYGTLYKPEDYVLVISGSRVVDLSNIGSTYRESATGKIRGVSAEIDPGTQEWIIYMNYVDCMPFVDSIQVDFLLLSNSIANGNPGSFA